MAVTLLRRLAARAPAPVYPVIGEGGLEPAMRLGLAEDVGFVASVRQAAILLICGRIDNHHREAVDRLHDQLPHPRATIWWDAEPSPGWEAPLAVAASGDARATVVDIWQALVREETDSESDRLPDKPPHEWRGVGPNGQGGKGMMGGTPYGRPMAMSDEDIRDGLKLDRYEAGFGPFLPVLPPGLEFKLVLQGDLVQHAAVVHPPYRQGPLVTEPLYMLSRIVRLLDLTALADRLLAGAVARRAGETVDTPALLKTVRRAGALVAIPPGLAVLGDGNDTRQRVEAWMAAAEEGRHVQAKHEVPPIGELLAGLEWQEALLALNSLTPDQLTRACEKTGSEADADRGAAPPQQGHSEQPQGQSDRHRGHGDRGPGDRGHGA